MMMLQTLSLISMGMFQRLKNPDESQRISKNSQRKDRPWVGAGNVERIKLVSLSTC